MGSRTTTTTWTWRCRTTPTARWLLAEQSTKLLRIDSRFFCEDIAFEGPKNYRIALLPKLQLITSIHKSEALKWHDKRTFKLISVSELKINAELTCFK